MDLQAYPEPGEVSAGMCQRSQRSSAGPVLLARAGDETKGVSDSVAAGEDTSVADRHLCPPSSFVGCSGPLMGAAQELI